MGRIRYRPRNADGSFKQEMVEAFGDDTTVSLEERIRVLEELLWRNEHQEDGDE